MICLPEHSLTPDSIHCIDCFALLNGLPSASVHAIITDMPYGTTACSWDTRVDMDRWWPAVKRVLMPRGVFVTTASEPFASLLRVSNLEWYKYDWIIDKKKASSFLDANRKPLKVHEMVCVFAPNSTTYNPQMIEGNNHHRGPNNNTTDVYGDFNLLPVYQSNLYYPKSIIAFSFADTTNTIHPTQKPVALYEYLIRTYTQPGDIVLDPFCGSGTTALAAFRTDRHYICGDSDPGYVTIARQRLNTADVYTDTPLDASTTQLSLFDAARLPGLDR